MEQQKQKGATVNYVYFLGDNKEFSELECLLFKYSFLKTKSHGFIVNIHCNKKFQDICQELEIVPDFFIPLEEDPSIDFKTFWAYHKIKVYDKQPIGEWHLDVDAIFKEKPLLHEVDLQTAYLDIPENENGEIPLTTLFIPEHYDLPEFAQASYIGLNMSALIFHNQELKDLYCQNALSFMKNNFGIDSAWNHMVYIEQSSIKQICEYYKYSYKFINEDSDYYHLGPYKHFMDSDTKESTINTLKNKIEILQWQ